MENKTDNIGRGREIGACVCGERYCGGYLVWRDCTERWLELILETGEGFMESIGVTLAKTPISRVYGD